MFRKLVDLWRGSRTEEDEGSSSSTPSPISDDLEESTSTQTQSRAESAMPGTSQIEIKLHLVPPPLDKDILDVEANKDPNRNFLPDPVAECAVNYPAARPFSRKALSTAMTREFRESILRPAFYVVTPQGRTLHTAYDGPDECIALIAAWGFRHMEDKTVGDIVAASRRLGQWLAQRPEGFEDNQLDPATVAKQRAVVERIMATKPESVGIVCFVDEAAPMMDGRRVWHILYSMGFKWGDMDCFQWADPTRQVDHLIWVEFNDENYGYVLPEEIAAGRQNFRWVNFTMEQSRTPAPEHVLEQLVMAAETFAHQLDCKIGATIDGKDAGDPDALRKAVSGLVAEYKSLNLKPAMESVMFLR
jgi:hypothetical protein